MLLLLFFGPEGIEYGPDHGIPKELRRGAFAFWYFRRKCFCTGVHSQPPCSFGQLGAIQPFSKRILCQRRVYSFGT